MSPARTALEHLLEARTALVHEAQRLADAVGELDALIATVGGHAATAALTAPDVVPARPPVGQPVTRPTAEPHVPARRSRGATRSPRKAAAKRGAPSRRATSGAAQKSIRVHVLEMLEAEDREFGLAEIIDRIHDAGIQAHDDAVRSITIKLMKDGQVERVGRGQYRLARGAAASQPAEPEEPVVEPDAEPTTQSEPAPYSPPLNLNEPWIGPQG